MSIWLCTIFGAMYLIRTNRLSFSFSSLTETLGPHCLTFYAVLSQNKVQPNPTEETDRIGIFNLGDADLVLATNAIKTKFVCHVFCDGPRFSRNERTLIKPRWRSIPREANKSTR